MAGLLPDASASLLSFFIQILSQFLEKRGLSSTAGVNNLEIDNYVHVYL